MNNFRFLYLFFLIIFMILLLILISPIIDHFFYVDNKLEDVSEINIIGLIISHVILLGLLIYIFHYYIVKKYINYFRLNNTYVKIIDLIITLTLTGLQRNLIYKLRYLSNKHPIRSKILK